MKYFLAAILGICASYANANELIWPLMSTPSGTKLVLRHKVVALPNLWTDMETGIAFESGDALERAWSSPQGKVVCYIENMSFEKIYTFPSGTEFYVDSSREAFMSGASLFLKDVPLEINKIGCFTNSRMKSSSITNADIGNLFNISLPDDVVNR